MLHTFVMSVGFLPIAIFYMKQPEREEYDHPHFIFRIVEDKMDQEEQWIEDGDDETTKDYDDEEGGRNDLFADPRGDFEMTFEDGITINLSGIKTKFPMLLQSTGLTLWKSSKNLGTYLCANQNIVRDKSVIELGAGLGLCGLVAHKLGAQKVVLTDGDTDTLGNMRDNVSNNIEDNGEVKDTIICKQLLWGRNVEGFKEKWAPNGFDVVMVCFMITRMYLLYPTYIIEVLTSCFYLFKGSDIIYAKEYIEDMFQTVSVLLSSSPGSVFLVSHMKRNPTLSFDSVFECAEKNGFQWSAPDGDTEEGMYTFYRSL